MIQLYGLTLNDPWEEPLLTDLLSGAPSPRQQQAGQYRFPEDRIRCILGEAAVRALACTRANVPPEAVRYAQNQYGKPRFVHPAGYHFNIAHAGRWILVAWGNEPAGVDVEAIETMEPAVARLAFHPAEYRFCMMSDRRISFYRIWTLKESYVKYFGEGLSTPLDSFCFLPEKPGADRLVLHGKGQSYLHFTECRPDKEHLAAVCTKSGQVGPLQRLTPADLSICAGALRPEQARLKD